MIYKVKPIHYSAKVTYTKDHKKISKPAVKYYLVGTKDHYAFNFVFKDSSNPLSRILQYAEELGCVIISASRSSYSPEENVERSHQLEKDIRSYGFGYRPSIGGGFPETNENGEIEEVETELSFIVVKPREMGDGEFLNTMLELGKKYEQNDITVAIPSINSGKPSWINTSEKFGETDWEFNRFRPTQREGENADQYYTQEKRSGKMFSFVDSVKKDINGKEYKFRTCDQINLEDVINYYHGYKLVPLFNTRTHGEYNYDYSGTEFFIKKGC